MFNIRMMLIQSNAVMMIEDDKTKERGFRGRLDGNVSKGSPKDDAQMRRKIKEANAGSPRIWQLKRLCKTVHTVMGTS